MRATAIAVLLFIAADLSAARFEVMRDGAEVADAQVCVFRAGATDNPITRFLTSSDVKCTPAASSIELGSGHWNVFARKGRDLVSERVLLLTAADMRDHRPRLDLVAAATIETSENETLFVWIPRTRSAMPVTANTPVPAGTVIPMFVAKDTVTRIGAPVTLVAGEVRKLERVASRGVDVVVPIAFRSVPRDGGDPPQVAVVDAKGKRHTPLVGLAKGDVAIGECLMFFREVPAGTLTATLDGKRWKRTEAKLETDPSRVAVLGKPLDARTTSKLTLHWWTTANLAQLGALPRSCKETPVEESPFRAKLLFCGDDKRKLNKYIHASGCAAVGERTLEMDALRGDATFEDVPAGVYLIVVDTPRLPALEKQFDVRADEATELDFELRWFTFFGKVTRDGQPVAAELYGAVSDPTTGRYDAVLPRNPRDTPMDVATCDGSAGYTIVPDAGPVENAAFDVEIARNRIDVEVVDADTNKALADTTVSLGAAFDDEPLAAHFGGPAGKTDEQGKLVIEPVLMNKHLHICASRDDYEGACADPFKMADSKQRAVRLALKRTVKRQGRIITSMPIDRGAVVWVTRDGRISEMVRQVDTDGRFTWKKPHAEDEVLSFTAVGHPLFATLHPRVNDGEELIVRIPAAPRRTFQVFLSEEEKEGSFIALRVGQMVISINVLAWHLARHDLQASLQPGHSVLVPDILATGPIRVILVPGMMLSKYPDIEMPHVPEMGAFPQQDLGDRDTIMFGGQTPRAIATQPALPSSH